METMKANLQEEINNMVTQKEEKIQEVNSLKEDI